MSFWDQQDQLINGFMCFERFEYGLPSGIYRGDILIIFIAFSMLLPTNSFNAKCLFDIGVVLLSNRLSPVINTFLLFLLLGSAFFFSNKSHMDQYR